MSSDKPIPIVTSTGGPFVAPTPQNTPMVSAPIGGGLSKPTVPDIAEGLEELGIDVDDEDDEDGEEDDDDQAREAIKNTMLGMVQGRLATLIGKSSGYIENLPLPVKRRVEGLKGVHQEYLKLELEYRKELLELDKKYLTLYNPIYERRQKILTGEIEPTEEEVKAGEAQSLKDDPESQPLSEVKDTKEGADIKGIPEFWLTALRNHMDISELITERDEEAMRSLTDIRLEYLHGQEGFKIHFHFGPNAYFTNPILTKTYYYEQDADGVPGDWDYSKAEGTKIQWKDDKDLTKEYEIRRQRNKNTNRTRTVKKTKDVPSFFDFFSPPVKPAEDAVETGEMSEEAFSETMYGLDMDFDIGEELKEKVIPRAIDWFTGKALEYDPDLEHADDMDDEDGLDEDDEDDDEESDEDYVAPPKKKVGKAGASGGGKAEAEECKNQ